MCECVITLMLVQSSRNNVFHQASGCIMMQNVSVHTVESIFVHTLERKITVLRLWDTCKVSGKNSLKRGRLNTVADRWAMRKLWKGQATPDTISVSSRDTEKMLFVKSIFSTSREETLIVSGGKSVNTFQQCF